MFPNVDKQDYIVFNNQLKHYPIADVNGHRRQATQLSLQAVKPQGWVMGVKFE